MKSLLNFFFPIRTAHAHCDIPCGIYDPHNAQMGAHTVIRMAQLINELQGDTRETEHKLVRYTKVKEEHADIVKHEVTVLWGDYFKEEHLKEFPNLTEAVYHTLKLASKAKQEINVEVAKDLLSHVHEIAEIFYKTKGVKTNKVKAPYPTEGELIVPA
jgi:nickel superoxide dismutase